MNTFKKSILAIVAASTVAFTAAPAAYAGNNWQKPFVKGLGQGVGFGLGFGVINALSKPAQPTYVQCSYYQQPIHNQWGQVIGYQQVSTC